MSADGKRAEYEPAQTIPSWPRQLDAAERYFWLLDRLACAPIGAVAELDRVLTRRELETALASVQSRHPLLRARIEVSDGEPLLVEAPAPITLSVCESNAASLTADLAALLDQPFPEDGRPMVRLVSLPIGPKRSAVVLLAHHALIDGQGAVVALRDLFRAVESGACADPSMTVTPPPPLHDRFPPEQRAARYVRDVLSEVRAERSGLPAPTEYPFHARQEPRRRTRLHALLIDPVNVLVSAARGARTTVHGLVAAAALESAAALLGVGRKQVLTVASPTDLRSRVQPPLPPGEVMLATGLLCTPYTVAGDTSHLARRISEQTHRELARGESHLFYRLARAGSYAATEAGVDQFASWLGNAPLNIAISNLGVMESAGDPAWVRSLSASLSPSANQLAFVVLTTYRGRLTILVATDAEKLSRPLADTFVAGLACRVNARQLPSSDDPSIGHAPTGRRPIAAASRMASGLV
jgi:phenolphthiocerol/phthiocerol/phthiodiolone dimycocerosyl transferase